MREGGRRSNAATQQRTRAERDAIERVIVDVVASRVPLIVFVWIAIAIASTTGNAEVRSTDVRQLTRMASLIVIGTTTVVFGEDDERWARVRVEQVLKGDARVGDLLPYFASATWTCDTTHARADEKALLFLGKATHDGEVPRALAGEQLWGIVWEGRGRMRVDEVGGQEVATIQPEVSVPSRLTNHADREHEVAVSLVDLAATIASCASQQTAQMKSCDEEPMQRLPGAENAHVSGDDPILTRRWESATCRAYEHGALVERRDANGIVLEWRPRGSSCARDWVGDAPNIMLARGMKKLMVAHPWLAIMDADADADADASVTKLRVFDSRDGREVFVARTPATARQQIFSNGERASLSFTEIVDAACDARELACRLELGKRLGMPNQRFFELHDCDPEVRPRRLAVEARIADLSHVDVEYPVSDFSCVK